MTLGALAELADKVRRVVPAAQAKRQTAGKREHRDEAREQAVDDGCGDVQLYQGGQDAENDNCPPGKRAQEVRRVELGAHHGSRNQPPEEIANDDRSEHHKNRHDDIRDVGQDVIQERREAVQAKDVGGREKEHDGQEPVYDLAQKPRSAEAKTRSLEVGPKPELHEERIELQSIKDLFDQCAQARRNSQADHENDECAKKIRKERDHAEPQALQRPRDDVSPILNNHCV